MDLYHVEDNFLSQTECQQLIFISEAIGYAPADISYSAENGGPKMNVNYRNNLRVLYKNEDLRLLLQQRLHDLQLIPTSYQQFSQGEVINHSFVELSGNFRFYKYEAGHFFKKHRDGNEQYSNGISFITLLLYLNTVEQGGYTNLIDSMLPEKKCVRPVEGRLLMFDHSVLHEGEELLSGHKYILRTDLIYKHG